MNNQQMVVFLLEILYYSLFLKASKRKLNFVKVFIVYLLSNIGLYFIGFQSFYAYVFYVAEIYIIAMLLDLKLLLQHKVETGLFRKQDWVLLLIN